MFRDTDRVGPVDSQVDFGLIVEREVSLGDDDPQVSVLCVGHDVVAIG